MRLPHLTIEQFTANSDHVIALREFLSSETGQAMLSVLYGRQPLRLLAKSDVTGSGSNLRAVAAAESVDGRSDNILGRCEGYESAIELLTHDLITHRPEAPAQSRKAGRSSIPPVKAPKP